MTLLYATLDLTTYAARRLPRSRNRISPFEWRHDRNLSIGRTWPRPKKKNPVLCGVWMPKVSRERPGSLLMKYRSGSYRPTRLELSMTMAFEKTRYVTLN